MTEVQTKTLWQIGKPGTGGEEFVHAGGWQAEFTYTVGSDADPINQPNMPPLLTVAGRKQKPKRGSKQLYATEKLNISFTLDNDYSDDELTLFYDFLGSETDSIFVNGEKLTEILGLGEGKLKQNQISLPALRKGEHVLSVTTAGGADGAHWIDYLKLEGVNKENQTEQPTVPSAATGLEDYAYWLKTIAKEQAAKAGEERKPFRRGRIWA